MLSCAAVGPAALAALCARYGLRLRWCARGQAIPGSYWGEPEAGLIGRSLLLRCDTPVHSALHETCHFICMDNPRRQRLHTDAGGDDTEENAVCYLQILLASYLPDLTPARLMADMDAWGYGFRLGSTRAWFGQDADDARVWLEQHRLIDSANRPTWRLRS